ncbi:hypothetical protein QJS10_CPB18g00751 [Acorus calamus]|uniref:VOC domain-containing protein n=1 Tax=Acorus calamus TaxID=4465 RepID=A0AAV9CK61_ACOCL|nr:hypothetical protein QJS10_CPB18g00751 [Acorus calamus]
MAFCCSSNPLFLSFTKPAKHVPMMPSFINMPSTKSNVAIVGTEGCRRTCIVRSARMSSHSDLLKDTAVTEEENGLKINEARPNEKLPYRGAWLWVGSEMIHLMELPNPDPLTGRPEHGGRDRHACIAIRDVFKLKAIFDKAGISYTLSRSGRPAIFARDPDGNALEFTQVD